MKTFALFFQLTSHVTFWLVDPKCSCNAVKGVKAISVKE